MKIPFSTISKIHATNEHLFSLIAVMLDGVETYRYLVQAINHDCTGNIEMLHIVYETTFTDRELAYKYWEGKPLKS